MAPVDLRFRVNFHDEFEVEIDDEEDVDSLVVVVMSLRADLGEELRLCHKGRVLKGDSLVKDIGFKAGDFLAVSGKKEPEAAAAAAAAATAPQPAATVPPTATPPVAAGGASVEEPPAALVEQLCSMGFGKAQVVQALRAAFNNPDRAVEYLFNGIPPSASAAAAPNPAPAPMPAAVPAAAAPAPAPAAAPPAGGAAATASWAETVLGPQLLTKSGPRPTKEALGNAEVVALYFSAHWCPPCRAFTPQLARASQMVPPEKLTVIFVSSDRDPASFTSYYAEQPWLAVPYEAAQRQMLGMAFQVRGIPTLMVLEGKTGKLITRDGKQDIASNGFNLYACLSKWGVNGSAAPAAAPTAPSGGYPSAAAAPAAAPASTGYPANGVAAASTAPVAATASKAPPVAVAIDDEAVDAALQRVAGEPYEVQEAFFKTALKVLDNTLQSPDEPKFRQLKLGNAALRAKLFDVADSAGLALLEIAGFAAAEDEVLTLPGPPDGKCTAVRERIQKAATAAWEKKAREDRDKRIAEEIEKDKSRVTRYGGEDGGGTGRTNIGRRGPPRSGGG